MKLFKNMNKIYLPLFLVLTFSFGGYAQNSEEGETNEDSVVDEIIDSFFDEKKDKSVEDLLAALFKEQKDFDELMNTFSDFKFLYMSLNYNTDTYFSGEDIGVDQYNIRPQVTYINSKGFFAGISGIYYQELEPKWNFTSLSLGYGKSFGKNNIFRLSGSYSRFLYSKGADNPYTNSLSIGVTIRNKKRTFGSRFSVNESFGDEEFFTKDNLFQVALSTYGLITLVKKSNYRIQLRPRINISAGQQIAFVEDGTILLIEDGVGVEYINFEEKTVFDFRNTQMSIPVLYSNKSWDFEIGYSRNFPHALEGEEELKSTGFVNFSLGYLLEL